MLTVHGDTCLIPWHFHVLTRLALGFFLLPERPKGLQNASHTFFSVLKEFS